MHKNRLRELLTVFPLLAFSFIFQIAAQVPTPKPTPLPTPKIVTTPTPKPTPTPNIEDDNEILKVYSRLVVVPVAVTDNLGQPVLNLTKEDFRLEEEGSAQQIEQLSKADEVPLEIALLIDVSGSTDPLFKFEQETAAKFLQGVMKSDDRASIFTIGEIPLLVQSRENAQKSAETIKSLKSTIKPTAFYDSIIAASRYLKLNSPTKSRRVVIVISDGEDNFSSFTQNAEILAYRQMEKEKNTLTRERKKEIILAFTSSSHTKAQAKVLQELQNADTVFYAVNPTGPSYRLNLISTRAQNAMQSFSDETGGTAFLPKKSDDLTLIFKQITNELRAQYLLQYYSDTDYPNNKYVKIKVGLPNQVKLRVRSRQGFFSVTQ